MKEIAIALGFSQQDLTVLRQQKLGFDQIIDGNGLKGYIGLGVSGLILPMKKRGQLDSVTLPVGVNRIVLASVIYDRARIEVIPVNKKEGSKMVKKGKNRFIRTWAP